jgi:acyl dehydratase
VPNQYKVGDTFAHTRECDKYRPIYYAGASGDFNPIHIDNEVGEMAGLGGVILQGLCTMGWAAESAINFLGDPGRIRRVRVRFSRPVSIGDVIRFEGKVASLKSGHMTCEIVAKNQRGDEVLKGAIVEAEVD